jgi:deoxyribodipyrimidine photo-lyase
MEAVERVASRLRHLNRLGPRPGRYVLYWMQAAQRTEDNLALEWAIREANALDLPLVVCFGLHPAYPGANTRHYVFMLEGLTDVAAALRDRGIALVVRIGSPEEGALALAQEAALMVMDRGYLRHQRAWYAGVAEEAPCAVLQAEDNVVVPTAAASDHLEYDARTLRPKIMRQRDRYLAILPPEDLRRGSLGIDISGEDPSRLPTLLSRLTTPHLDILASPYHGGQGEARARLAAFCGHGLAFYAARRNDPSLEGVSHLSPYLHFGQISLVRVALESLRVPGESCDAFLEELVVRRELAINYVLHQPAYDRWEGLPAWARATLTAHANDPRPAAYPYDQLALAHTHDPYWNAAQREMVLTGKMHGYMRMYWGKKIIEWSPRPDVAQQWMLALNDTYELDGRDPNGYTGVAWCLGLHDRPWQPRPIFGNVRYMAASGLERKFDIGAYVRRIEALSVLGNLALA